MTLTPEDLVELEQIKRLKYRYMRGVDQKDWDLVESTFVPEATAAYGDGKYSFEGRDAIMAFLRESMDTPTMITMHQVQQPEIDLVSPTEATGSWALEDRVIMTEYKLTLRGAAYYSDRYVKVDGEWRIAHTGYKRLFEEMEPRSDAIQLSGPR